MGIFRRVDTGFWSEAYITELEPEQKLLMLYLLTNANTTLAGAYAIHPKKISAETGIGVRRVRGMIEKLERDGRIVYDAETMEVAVKDWGRHNSDMSAKARKRAWEDVETIRSGAVKSAAQEILDFSDLKDAED